MNIKLVEKSRPLHSSRHRSTRRKRGRHDIISEILKATLKGARKSRVLQRVGLSTSQLRTYLRALKDAGFLSEESGIWKTTKKGLHVIEACEMCHRLIKEAQ